MFSSLLTCGYINFLIWESWFAPAGKLKSSSPPPSSEHLILPFEGKYCFRLSRPFTKGTSNKQKNKNKPKHQHMRIIFLSPMHNNSNGYELFFRNLLLNEKEGISVENAYALLPHVCYTLWENHTNWGLNSLIMCSPTCTFIFRENACAEISATALILPRSLFSRCSLLLLRTTRSITKSSKTPTKIQEMVTSIFSPSFVASPSSFCTTDLISGGIVPGNRAMRLDAY